MEFNDYLISKNISPDDFNASETSLYLTWEKAFIQMHPNSFTEQHKFQLNKIRRKYILKKVF